MPWVVAGSVASSIRGEPRATNDIDLVANLGAHQNQLTRRQLLRVGADDPPLIVPILSVEDMILQKVRWRESGGGVSDQQ